MLVCGNVRNRALLDRVLRDYNVDVVVHFAAESHVDDSYKKPHEFVRCNVEGTVTLLEACRAYGRVKRFVYVNTDEVYGDSEFGKSEKAKTELDIFQPTNPYAASKASAEHFVIECTTSPTSFLLLRFACATRTVQGKCPPK